MTIRSDILALSPQLYWPLDDLGGPTAVDASGHGHDGTYLPGTILQVPGPELNTLAIAAPVQAIGVNYSAGNPFVLPGSFTFLVWIGAVTPRGSGSRVCWYLGNSGANGIGWVLSVGGKLVDILLGGINEFGSATSLLDGVWNQVALTYNNAGTSILYVNTAGAFTSAGHTPNATGPTSLQLYSPGTSVYLAHAALWTSVLTQVQVQNVYSNAVLAPNQFATGATATNIDTQSLETKLDNIYKAVHTTFPTT